MVVIKGGPKTLWWGAGAVRKGRAREVKINIAARLRASRQYQGLDLTGRRGSFTRSSLLCLLTGQIREHQATLKSHLLALTRGRRDGENGGPRYRQQHWGALEPSAKRH